MSIQIRIPDIGDAAVDVIEVLISEGDEIQAEASVLVLESDKASMEVPAEQGGKVSKVLIKVGDQVKEGDVIAELEASESGGDSNDADKEGNDSADNGQQGDSAAEKGTTDDADNAASKAQDEQDKEQAAQKAAASADEKSSDNPPSGADKAQAGGEKIDEAAFSKAHASPSVRRFARELGADLSKVQGSGRKGRILEEDVKSHIKQALSTGGASAATAVTQGSGIPPIPSVDFSKFGDVEEQKLSRINILTGEAMTRCWLNIPHVTQHDLADITELEAFRKALKPEAEKRGVRVTMLAFLMKALAKALQELPRFNTSLSADKKSLIVKKYIHLGIAVDTPNGLVVPVIRDVDKKGIYALSEDLMAMSKKARDGKLSPSDMQGASMTISSLGGIGGTYFTPIVNAPEVAILGVSRSSMQPVWNGKEFAPRMMLPLSLSYDHRVIDGALAARMTVLLGQLLADMKRTLL